MVGLFGFILFAWEANRFLEENGLAAKFWTIWVLSIVIGNDQLMRSSLVGRAVACAEEKSLSK